MSILTVGAGQQYSTLAKAVAAAQDGDTIAVQAGTYTNDFTTIARNITIEGVGGVAKFVATVAPPNGKAIMVTQADVTVRNLEFSGAKVADDNGAGIRYEGGHLTVENSYFHHNQMGLLSNGDSDGTITVRNSEFAFNGGGDGYTHGLYVNRIQSLVVEDSYFHDANNGHHIKSRAASTTITNNRVLDGPDGISSYNIDLPNGGNALIENNVVQQNGKSPNIAIISYGAEGNLHSGGSLRIAGNVVVDDLESTNATMLVNHTSTVADVSSNDVWGLTSDHFASGPAILSGNSLLTSRPQLDTSSTWDDAPAVAPAPAPAPSPILGSDGNDSLAGTSVDDTLDGLAGNDSLNGGGGGDRMIGGAGNDVFYVDNARDIIVEYAKQGADTVKSSVSYALVEFVEDLTLTGTASINGTGNGWHNVVNGNAGANTLSGLAGDDKLYGQGGGDRLLGGDGNDRLYGGSGADRLEGGAGNDFFQAGTGTDTLTGGSGADIFDWNLATDAGKGSARDIITDFVRGSDKIDLSGIDAVADTAGNNAFSFIGTRAFDGVDGQLRFYDGGGYAIVQGDIDGDRLADVEIRLDGITSLGSTDFVL